MLCEGLPRSACEAPLIQRFRQPDGLAFEEARYRLFQDRAPRTPELHLWTHSPCLVTSNRMRRKAGFREAAAASAARGWPVLVRGSGGGTVFHAPGVLCISALRAMSAAAATVDNIYGDFCGLLRMGLAKVGVETQLGSAPGAPCDGRYNVLVAGRKLAGTAARVRLQREWAYVQTHAALLIHGNYASGLEAVERFERDLGLASKYSPDCCAALCEYADLSDSMAASAAALWAAFRDQARAAGRPHLELLKPARDRPEQCT